MFCKWARTSVVSFIGNYVGGGLVIGLFCAYLNATGGMLYARRSELRVARGNQINSLIKSGK